MSLDDILKSLLGVASAAIVSLVTGLFNAFRRLSRIEEQATDRQAQIVELRLMLQTELSETRGDIKSNRDLIDDLRPMKEQVGLLWRREEARSLEGLRHRTQDEFDGLIDEYKAGRISVPRLNQFVQRLEVIASGGGDPEQVPFAEMTLVNARAQLALRLEHPETIDAVTQQVQLEEDRLMAEKTKAESDASEARGAPSDLERVEGKSDHANHAVAEVSERVEEVSERVEEVSDRVDKVVEQVTAGIATVEEGVATVKEGVEGRGDQDAP